MVTPLMFKARSDKVQTAHVRPSMDNGHTNDARPGMDNGHTSDARLGMDNGHTTEVRPSMVILLVSDPARLYHWCQT